MRRKQEKEVYVKDDNNNQSRKFHHYFLSPSLDTFHLGTCTFFQGQCLAFNQHHLCICDENQRNLRDLYTSSVSYKLLAYLGIPTYVLSLGLFVVHKQLTDNQNNSIIILRIGNEKWLNLHVIKALTVIGLALNNLNFTGVS